MKKSFIFKIICSFLIIFPAYGSSEAELFEQELSAFTGAQNNFIANPCVKTLEETIRLSTALFQAAEFQAFTDLQNLIRTHGEPQWEKACEQTKMLLKLQPYNPQENPSLGRYLLPSANTDLEEETTTSEIIVELCQKRAECAILLENFVSTKDNFYDICAKTKNDLLISVAQSNLHTQNPHEDLEPEALLLHTPTPSTTSTEAQILTQQWDLFDRYHTLFNQTSSFYWCVEKELARTLIKDRQNNASEDDSTFLPLWSNWADSAHAQTLRANCITSLSERLPLLLYTFLIVEERLKK